MISRRTLLAASATLALTPGTALSQTVSKTQIAETMKRATRFMVEKLALDGLAKRETRERAIGTDHAMTRHEQADGIGGVGAADGARGPGITEFGGELAVATNLSKRNRDECSPYALLKLGSLRGQRH